MSVATIFNQTQLRKFPIISIVSVPTPGTGEGPLITYGQYNGGFVKVTWSTAPTALLLSELNRLLSGNTPDSILTYLYSLPQEDRDRIIADAVVTMIRFNPFIPIKIGIPIDII